MYQIRFLVGNQRFCVGLQFYETMIADCAWKDLKEKWASTPRDFGTYRISPNVSINAHADVSSGARGLHFGQSNGKIQRGNRGSGPPPEKYQKYGAS